MRSLRGTRLQNCGDGVKERMDTGRTQKVHFIGICGTAMGAVAAALVERGVEVTGSDANFYPPMSDFLREMKIGLKEGYAAENVPVDVDCVVIGNALSRGNPEVEAVLNERLRYVSLPELMREQFLRGRRNYVVTGTHGKTTTTALLAWIFERAMRNPSYMIGGLPRNFCRGAKFGDGEDVILEGDEYDTAFFDKRSKFLHYLPYCVLINNIEFDHADIFKDLGEIKKSFSRLLRVVPSQGLVLVNADDVNCLELMVESYAPVRRVGFAEDAENRIEDVVYEVGRSLFTLGGVRYTIPLLGEYNVRNAAMALSAARYAGISEAVIHDAFATFKGISRRQEVRGEVNGIAVVDDFAHHPTSIRLAIESMRQQFPGRRIWALFEPRSNSTRRNIFQDALVDALAFADKVIISGLVDYSRIPEEERLDVEAMIGVLVDRNVDAYVEVGVDELVGRMLPLVRSGDVVLVLSNGGFGGIHKKLLTAFEAIGDIHEDGGRRALA